MKRPGKYGRRAVSAWGRACLCAALVLGFCSRANADDSAVLSELQARIESVERQNQRLLRALRERRVFDDRTTGDEISLIDENESEDGPAADDKRIRAIVRDYVASQQKDASSDADASPWYEVGSDLKMTASWRNGLEIETRNKDFRVHVGGRTQFDSGWYNAPQSVQQTLPGGNRFRDGVDFRRARFRIDGVMYETMEWAAEFDFVNSAGVPSPISVVAPTDLWWQFNSVPIFQHVRIGNQKEPIGFEHLTSSRFLNFMERSFLQDAFNGGFNNGFTPGAQVFGTMADERMTYAFGGFNVTTNAFASNTGSGEYSMTGRLTALPYYVDEGAGLLHLGMSARYWGLDEHQARFRTRASVRSALSATWPIIADTGLITADTDEQINVELVGQWGQFSFNAEFLTSWLQKAERPKGTSVGPVIYRGGYVEALYFLTGEHRVYNRKTAVWDRVVPIENAFFADGEDSVSYGWGAWQLAARYQFLDLNSNGFDGGILHDSTLGVNWFLNPNFKVQGNYFYLNRQGPKSPAGDGVVQGFGIRLAHDY